jgi:hypothetical protein
MLSELAAEICRTSLVELEERAAMEAAHRLAKFIGLLERIDAGSCERGRIMQVTEVEIAS